MSDTARRVSPPVSELIDRLTIDQIKQVKNTRETASYEEEIAHIESDIDSLVRQARIRLDAETIRLVIALAQINLHIWHAKEDMVASADGGEKMKLAHQLNGLRNQIKNRLLSETGARATAAHKSNTSTDQLGGWDLSILRAVGTEE